MIYGTVESVEEVVGGSSVEAASGGANGGAVACNRSLAYFDFVYVENRTLLCSMALEEIG
jgi:hypothetical protein